MKVFVLWLILSEYAMPLAIFDTRAECESERRAVLSQSNFHGFICIHGYQGEK